MLRPRYIETPYKQIPAPLQKEEAIAISKPHQKKKEKKRKAQCCCDKDIDDQIDGKEK
jgi:hypothetical protein